MDDDDEIHSHASPATGSPPESPRANGRITVTVASAAPPPPPQQNCLTLALPIQQPRNGGSGGGGGREDCWSEGATAVLIEAWGERYLELSRGNLKQKHWKEVADIVSSREDYMKTPKTDIQCKNRIDTVKKKYKLEKAKAAAGGGPSKWPFFDRLEHLIGPSSKISGTNSPNPSASASYRVPLGIPVGVRSAPNQFPSEKNIKNKLPQRVLLQNQNQKQKIQIRRRDLVKEEDESEESEAEPDSPDSFPPPMGFERKRPRTQRELNTSALPVPAPARGRQGGKEKGWGNSVKELTAAILKFGETYEQAERAKLQQVMEMEKQRMKFAKELELQRMQFFMKTQLEISQLKHGRKGGKNNNHHSSNNNNNSDSSN